ncbi:MAG: DNA-processing protein DprA [Gammaproteobacteria bacterium]|nr:DNA-processing protein DprA [Gammaproteobacteria bacterium]
MNKELDCEAKKASPPPANQATDQAVEQIHQARHSHTTIDPINHDQENPDLACWLAIHRAPGIGPATFQKLLQRFNSAQGVLDAPPAELAECGLRNKALKYLKEPDWKGVEQDLAWLKQPDNHILTLKDADYPPLLREITTAPPVLFVHGQLEALNSMQIAMVGSRNPSSSGRQTSGNFARHLASSGFTITSGLALGIDAASHEGALAVGGISIAVTGTGLDRVYPARHRDLAYRIAEQGALVSEFPIGTAPLPAHFPRRNRIISGLSLGTLVVEAAQKSGSLITAQHALEQGREVFAIPGSIHNPMARGCHQLIRQGAKLVETADDILSELAPMVSVNLAMTSQTIEMSGSMNEKQDLDPEYQQLINSMGYDEVAVDELVNRCQLTPESVSSMLLIMELQGYVTSGPGGLYSLVHK